MALSALALAFLAAAFLTGAFFTFGAMASSLNDKNRCAFHRARLFNGILRLSACFIS
jgi:hypothetical protein